MPEWEGKYLDFIRLDWVGSRWNEVYVQKENKNVWDKFFFFYFGSGKYHRKDRMRWVK